MKKLPLLLLFFLSLFSSTESKAQWVTIPDPNFVAFLQQNYPTCMNGNLMDTTCAGIVGATNVNCWNRAIQNLDGIQYFDALLSLYCYSNQLTSLPALPANLQFLDCIYNQLTSLPALPASLQTLYCYYNQLTSLPALPASLQFLSFGYNPLTSLPALPASLQYLSCSSNQLTSLPALPASLQSLYCELNQLTSLPALPASLQYLSCSSNQLTSLPALPANLRYLYCNNNQITCFPNLPVSLTSPGYFDISNNPFTCLPNYVPAMNGTSYLNYPLCIDNDLINNPNACQGSKAIQGYVYQDDNTNCIFDSSDAGIKNIPLQLYDGNNYLLSTFYSLNNGVYNWNVDTGAYTVVLDTANQPYAAACIVDSTVVLDTINPLALNVNFAIGCKPGFDVGTKSVS
ncbi:MAG: leucine-rich repeat protein, partial [Bacteroidota bacterium]